MLELVITHVIAIGAGICFSAWRLKGARTVKDAIKVVIQGGGGPGEESVP